MEVFHQEESHKLRSIASELNFLSRSDGSAIVSQGLPKLLFANF
jgi:ribonuclease PH